MEMSSEKREYNENNPFTNLNPNDIPAIIWEKIHNVEQVAVETKEVAIENKTDIKWLKREYVIQILLSGLALLLLICEAKGLI